MFMRLTEGKLNRISLLCLFTASGNVTPPLIVFRNKRLSRPISDSIPDEWGLAMNGHRTHLTYGLSQLCTELEIILIALYPNATRILQPADVSCFKPLKSYWKQGVLQWRRENPYCQLGKCHFAPILENALKHMKPETIINGFRACGLWPWCPNGLDFSKCLGKKYAKYP
ncbi:hypothetical protein NQ317_018507 [Molorchus minor]|uniref:DDE-1 domain-containing protein n=1 Tax=Molorchus minor TaxID=1323400 RepID=A0ABQ9J969_9CUCU|nr:hypothetical protein NQ317_018507 [Molorchus minor]